MSAFAGLVDRDAARLQLAASAWQSPPPRHVIAREWCTGTVLLRQWRGMSAPSGDSFLPETTDGWQVLGDGRLSDPEQLARNVGCDGALTTDALIQAAFRLWGDTAPQKIGGEFALAAWHPGHEELFLGRDAVGGHPLYYHAMADGLAFATDLPLLLRLPFVPRRLNDSMIATTLARDPQRPASTTYYQAIDLLPAGHCLSYGKTGLSVRRWWHPPRVEVRRPDAAAKLRDEITAAVEDRMRDGRRIAVHLSGGLDSSAIACIAARRLRQDGRRLLAFSSVLPSGWRGPETDERAHVEAVLAQEDNIDIHWLDLPAQHSPFAASEPAFELLGQPAYSNAAHIERQFAELGRELGVDVVLSGFGGDVFASWRGQGVVQTFLREGHWRQAATELLGLHRRKTGTWPRLIKREILAPFVARIRVHGEWRLRAMRGELPVTEPGRQPAPVLGVLRFAHPREQMRFVADPGRIELSLNANVQIFDRGFGQSLRFPLLDRRIIEFMLSVPADELQRNGETRSLFRRAMKGVLPESVRLRRDKGPAFDPIIAARVVAARQDLQAWAARTVDEPSWRHADRAKFLRELAAVRPAPREGWRPGMFQDVLLAGTVARFIEWHAQREQSAA